MIQLCKKLFEEIIKPLLTSILIDVLQIMIKQISLSLKKRKLIKKLRQTCNIDDKQKKDAIENKQREDPKKKIYNAREEGSNYEERKNQIDQEEKP